jgi:phosphoribosylanthranilate isomerase
MWIKICGMTSAAAVAAALDAAVDAIGFVLAPSARRLSARAAAQLAAPARGRVSCAAVMHHPTQDEVDAALAEFAPDLLQTDLSDFATLRLPATLGRLPVVRAGQALSESLPGRVLFEGPVSGTGTPCDWSAAGSLARRTELVLAGGLTAENVRAAIGAVEPFGVDVSSGVEERPGVKSPAEIARFVRAARGGGGSK